MKDLVTRDQMIAYLAAQGKKNDEIAAALGMKKNEVRLKLTDQKLQFEIKHLRYKLYGKDPKKRFMEMLPHAMDVTESILTDPTAQIRTKFAAAQEVMDRALGKPTQTVQHEGSLMRTLLERLENPGKKATTIDVESLPEAEEVSENPNQPENSHHPIDLWVEKNI